MLLRGNQHGIGTFVSKHRQTTCCSKGNDNMLVVSVVEYLVTIATMTRKRCTANREVLAAIYAANNMNHQNFGKSAGQEVGK